MKLLPQKTDSTGMSRWLVSLWPTHLLPHIQDLWGELNCGKHTKNMYVSYRLSMFPAHLVCFIWTLPAVSCQYRQTKREEPPRKGYLVTLELQSFFKKMTVSWPPYANLSEARSNQPTVAIFGWANSAPSKLFYFEVLFEWHF